MKPGNPNVPARQPLSKSPSQQKEVLSFVLAAMKGVVMQENAPDRSKGVMKTLELMIKNWPLKSEQKKTLSDFFARLRFRPGFKPGKLNDPETIDEMVKLIGGLEGVSTQAAETMISSVRTAVSHSLKEDGKPGASSVDLRKKLKAYVAGTDLDPRLKRVIVSLLYIIRPEKYEEQWPTAEEILGHLKGSSESPIHRKIIAAREVGAKKEKPVRPHDLVDKGNRYMTGGQYLRAIKCFRLAIRLEKSGNKGKSALKEAYRQISERNDDTIILELDQLYPRDGMLKMQLGNIKLSINCFQEAQEYYRDAIVLDAALTQEVVAQLRHRLLIEESGGTSHLKERDKNYLKQVENLIKRLPLGENWKFVLSTKAGQSPEPPKSPAQSRGIPESWRTPAQEVVSAAMPPPIEQLFDEAEAKGFDWDNHNPADMLTGEELAKTAEVINYTDEELAETLVAIGWEVKPLDTAEPEDFDDEFSDLPLSDEPLDFELDVEPASPVGRPALGMDDRRDEVKLDEGTTLPDDVEADFFGNVDPSLVIEAAIEQALLATDVDDSDTTDPLPSSAEATTEELVQPLDRGVEAYIIIGRNHVFNGKHEKAIEAFRWVIKRSPDGEQAIFELLRSIIQENPSNACAHLLLGKLYLHKKQDRKSIEHFGYAVTLDPSLTRETPMALKLMRPDILRHPEGDVKSDLQAPALTSVKAIKEINRMGHWELRHLISHLEKRLASLKAARMSQGDIIFVQRDLDGVRAYFEAKFEPEKPADAKRKRKKGSIEDTDQ